MNSNFSQNKLTFFSLLASQYTLEGNRHEDVVRLLENPDVSVPEENFFVALRYMHLAVAYHAMGRQADAKSMAEKLDALDDQYEALWFASMYAFQGELDEAFAWLEIASADFPREYIENEPSLRALMNDPRWDVALQQFKSAYDTSD